MKYLPFFFAIACIAIFTHIIMRDIEKGGLRTSARELTRQIDSIQTHQLDMVVAMRNALLSGNGARYDSLHKVLDDGYPAIALRQQLRDSILQNL